VTAILTLGEVVELGQALGRLQEAAIVALFAPLPAFSGHIKGYPASRVFPVVRVACGVLADLWETQQPEWERLSGGSCAEVQQWLQHFRAEAGAYYDQPRAQDFLKMLLPHCFPGADDEFEPEFDPAGFMLGNHEVMSALVQLSDSMTALATRCGSDCAHAFALGIVEARLLSTPRPGLFSDEEDTQSFADTSAPGIAFQVKHRPGHLLEFRRQAAHFGYEALDCDDARYLDEQRVQRMVDEDPLHADISVFRTEWGGYMSSETKAYCERALRGVLKEDIAILRQQLARRPAASGGQLEIRLEKSAKRVDMIRAIMAWWDPQGRLHSAVMESEKEAILGLLKLADAMNEDRENDAAPERLGWRTLDVGNEQKDPSTFSHRKRRIEEVIVELGLRMEGGVPSCQGVGALYRLPLEFVRSNPIVVPGQQERDQLLQ